MFSFLFWEYDPSHDVLRICIIYLRSSDKKCEHPVNVCYLNRILFCEFVVYIYCIKESVPKFGRIPAAMPFSYWPTISKIGENILTEGPFV